MIESFLILTMGILLGIYLGNTSLRSKINEEIAHMINNEHSKRRRTTKATPDAQDDSKTKVEGNTCSHCGQPVDQLADMKGYAFCQNCEKVQPLKAKGKCRYG